MKISIFGLGYVGAVSSGCLAELGHEIIGVDVDERKVDLLRRGESPITEAGLPEILAKHHAAGRVSATTDPYEAIKRSDIAFLCVGTPSDEDGSVFTHYVERACREIGEAVRGLNKDHFAVLNRSTCLPNVHETLIAILADSSRRAMGSGIGYACHPEFLREGSAVSDFFNPPKIVFGTTDPKTTEICATLYPADLGDPHYTGTSEAAMVKYADNAFHAVKVTFGNEIGTLCKRYGIDSHTVMEIFCKDTILNLSPRYLRPGFAFGGSCLPKDLRAMLHAARASSIDLPMLAATTESNRVQIDRLTRRVSQASRQSVGIVGLAFKEGTDDVRESPMVYVAESLVGKGHKVRIFDPLLGNTERLIGVNRRFILDAIPHLSEMLTPDLSSLVGQSETVIVSHRLHPALWETVNWRTSQTVIDLMNIPSLRSAPGYEGIYW
jgi:GDP-mannose 6-dehydrogenase